MSIDRRGFLAACAAGAIETAFHARLARGFTGGQGEPLRGEGESVMGDSFRTRGVDMVAEQAGEGAGWLVITSAGSTPADIVDAGRRFERMFLLARERRIAIHPMTQILEEDLWRRELDVHAGIVPQFILRLGYLNAYPDPVSPRRPVSWFTVAGSALTGS
jgi:hypothetical protein